MRCSKLLVGSCVLVLVVMASRSAAAAGRVLEAEPLDDVKIRIDGDLREWPSKMTELGETIDGSASGGDPRVAVTLGYDDASLYVVLKITDQKLVRTSAAGPNEDHATLYLAFPKGQTYEVQLYPGDPGRVAGAVKLRGQAVSGAKIVEGPSGKAL